MTYRSTKTYGHDVGLSCCFRQWRADHSHCRFLHGYAIAVHLEFQAPELDERNWVIDFGGLGEIRDWLKATFDHKTLVAQDDPKIDLLRRLDAAGVIDMIEVGHTGCEAFSHLVYNRVDAWLQDNGHKPRVSLAQVDVREHGANSASWNGEVQF